MNDKLMVGMLGLMITMATLVGIEKLLFWLSRRAERSTPAPAEDIEERLARAEAAFNEAQRELASVREERAERR